MKLDDATQDVELDDLSDADLGALMRERIGQLAEAHLAGFGDDPTERWNEDSQSLRAHRAKLEDDARLQHLGAEDDPPATAGTPPPPERPGERVAQDAALERLIPGYGRLR